MTKQTKDEFLKEVERTGTTVTPQTRTFNGEEFVFNHYKEPALGRCDNCQEVKMWQKQKGLKLADVRCGACGEELKRTTYQCKLPYKANTPIGEEAKAREFARKILDEA